MTAWIFLTKSLLITLTTEDKYIIVPNDFNVGWPSGSEIYYECQICSAIIPSMQDGECRCGNITVDVGYGRAGAKKLSEVELLRRIKQ